MLDVLVGGNAILFELLMVALTMPFDCQKPFMSDIVGTIFLITNTSSDNPGILILLGWGAIRLCCIHLVRSHFPVYPV